LIFAGIIIIINIMLAADVAVDDICVVAVAVVDDGREFDGIYFTMGRMTLLVVEPNAKQIFDI
jgi:hypothetical protein